jgi:serine/threonine-protein kinase
MAPFLSPDARWVGFTRDGTLVRVPLDGGPAVSICEVSTGAAGTWLDDDTIVFGGEGTGGLQRVPAAGGVARPLTTPPGPGATIIHGLPQAVPGARAVLFTEWEGGRPHVALADVPGGSVRRLTPGQQPRHAGSSVVFVRERALWTAPIDVTARRLDGEPVPLREPVDVSAGTGAAHFAVAAPGTLVYLPRRSEQSRARSLVWVDRAGREEPVGIESAPFTRASIAPDGARIALAITAAEGRAIWIYARDRGTLTRLTPGSAADTAPIWTPDGERVIFRSERDGGGLFVVRADGAGPVTRLSAADRVIYTPYDVTRDGRLLLFTAFRTYRDQGIGVVPLDGSVPARAVVDGPAAEVRPHVSPDGRWVAYQSDESGRFEIYVRPWPAVEEGR